MEPDPTQLEIPNARDVTEEWTKRSYAPRTDEAAGDEDGVVYLWLKAYAHSRFGRVRGASKDSSAAERKYWREQAPVVEYLLRNAETLVACDPSRPDVIWAFACMTGDVVHFFAVKRSVVETVGEEFAGELLRDLLGDRLTRDCGMTHEMPWRACGLPMPARSDGKPLWYLDTTWFGRQLLTKRAA